MKVLYVVNNYYAEGNGLSASARRTVKYLKEAGLEVKTISAANPYSNLEEPDYILPDFKVPIFDGLVRKQGYSFSKSDDDVIREAVRWADVVHLEEPFIIQMRTCKIAKEEGVPLTATYHLHPENLYASIHMRKNMPLNNATMKVWKEAVFDNCKIIQCPTENVKERLVKWKYKADLRVISNGMLPNDDKLLSNTVTGVNVKNKDIYNVVCTGRYSVEKDQATLLKAMKYSKYADKIQLILLGQGPNEAPLKRLAIKLVNKGIIKNQPIFKFCTLDELKEIYKEADLYVHCAVIEVEGLSCMEAIQMGVVPIIAKGKLSATSQFALSDKSIFKEKDAKELAEKIDYWITHDEERIKEAKKYLGSEKKYDIHKSIDLLVKMYQDAIK